MRIVFAGTPEFAVSPLEALIEARHAVPLVLTQPDRPAGRGLAPATSAVKQCALRHHIDVQQPATLKAPEVLALLRALAPDAVVVVAYGLILPQAVLDIPRHGALNIHASLLPRWRGAAPIQRALLAGDRETGISIMQMDSGLDTGPVLMQSAVPISPHDTAGTLHDKLRKLGATLIVEAVDALERGAAQPRPQPAAGATYAPKIEKSESRIDWRNEACTIERQIRAFNPHPGAAARLRGTEIKIWRASEVPGAANAGEVIAAGNTGVTVACGGGALRLEELQRAGAKRLAAGDFLRGFPITAGDRFDDIESPRSTAI